MRDGPSNIWRDLEQSGKGDGVLNVVSRETGVETGFGPARLALGPKNERRLLLPCPAGTTGKELTGGPKLQSALISYATPNGHRLFIDLICQDRRLDVVFSEVCQEILHRISEGEGPISAVTCTIADFRELLISELTQSVNRSEVIGLIGELFTLKRLLTTKSDALTSWMGPYEQRHDFRRGTHALEVKTSSRSDATTISVNGAEQLSPPADGRLYLLHVRIEQTDKGVLSVGSLFDQIVSCGADERLLRQGISQLGCLDPQDPLWNALTFELQGQDAFEVTEGFPRVTPQQFPEGETPHAISELKYRVDLSAASDFHRSEEVFDQYIKDLLK